MGGRDAGWAPEAFQSGLVLGALLALVLYNSAVLAEIMRAGILSLPKGQGEAAAALGMTYRESLRHVILPQGLRRMVPATVSQLITLNKDTTLVSIIAITEVMRRGRSVTASNFFTVVEAPILHVFLFIGLLFVIVNYTLSRLSRRLELRERKLTGAARMRQVTGLEDQCRPTSSTDSSAVIDLPYLTAADVERRLTPIVAIDALEAALAAGFDPESDPPRRFVGLERGELIMMPSELGGHLAVKLVTVGGDPRVQGVVVVFDSATLAPVALIDGIALTNVRTAAVSALAVRHLARADASGCWSSAAARRPTPTSRRSARSGRSRRSISSGARPPARPSWSPPPTSSAAARRPRRRCSTARSCARTRWSSRSAPTTRTPARPTTRSRRARPWSSSRACRRCARRVTSSRDRVRRARRGRARHALRAGPRRAPLPPGPRLFKSTGMSWEDAVMAGALAAASPPPTAHPSEAAAP